MERYDGLMFPFLERNVATALADFLETGLL
jgi:hypothetical protein